ncbi:hypothetical protein BGX23_010899 [Mortierella sp. AD031]|nr:hypothetical protein BGX23_010899 [Mortierella sp. AD031]
MQIRTHDRNDNKPAYDQQPFRCSSPERLLVHTGNRAATTMVLDSDLDRIITTFDDPNILVHSASTGALLHTLRGHRSGVWSSSLHNNTLITGATDQTIRVWDLSKGICTYVFQDPHISTIRAAQIFVPVNINRHNPQLSLKYKPEFPIIVAGSRDSSLSGHTHSVRSLAAEGSLVVSGAYDRTVRVWNSHTGASLHTLVGHENKVYSVVLDTEHQRCMSGSMDASIRIWSLDTGNCLRVLTVQF